MRVFKAIYPFNVIAIALSVLFNITCNTAIAEGLQSYEALIISLKNVYNQNNEQKIAEFLSYNIYDEAQINIHSSLMDPKAYDQVMQEMQLTMNKQEFVKYRSTLNTQLQSYNIAMNITDVKIQGNTVILSVMTKEEALKHDASGYQNLNINGSCNYALIAKGSIYQIAGINCSEKILKYSDHNLN